MKIFKISETNIFAKNKKNKNKIIPTLSDWIKIPSVKKMLYAKVSPDLVDTLSLMLDYNRSKDHTTASKNLINDVNTKKGKLGAMLSVYYQMIRYAIKTGNPPQLQVLKDLAEKDTGPNSGLNNNAGVIDLNKIIDEYEYAFGAIPMVNQNIISIIKLFYEYLNSEFSKEIADCARTKLNPPNEKLASLVENYGLFHPDQMMKVTDFMPHHNYVVGQYEELARELVDDFTEKTTSSQFANKKNIMYNKITSNRGITQVPTKPQNPSQQVPSQTQNSPQQTNPQSATNPTGTTPCSILLAPTVISGISCVLLELVKMTK